MPRKSPPPAKPQPRTIKKAPVKRCEGGHIQSARWKPHQGCWQCDREEREAANRIGRGEAARAEKAKWREIMGPPPAVLEMRVTSTGKLIRYAIPPHLLKKHPARRRARARI